MEKIYTRFPRRWAWRVVDRIMEAASDLDPGDPYFFDQARMDMRRYRYLEAKHADLDRIWRSARELRDDLGSLR